MVKQPKYFVSRLKATPTTPVAPVSVTPVAVVASGEPAGVQRFLQVRTRFPRYGLPAIGVMTLLSLCVLVGVNTGIIQAVGFQKKLPVLFQKPATTGVIVAEARSVPGQGLTADIQAADARVEIVRAFLARYKSPLTPHDHYAAALVTAADRYGLDYRLLPAIMMQESNLCKTSDPTLHNCLGFGIHARGTLGFDTYEEGFDRAARELKANYIDQGLVTPEQIMKKYTPSSNGSWAASVNQWIAEMEHNDRQKGLDNESDASLLEYTQEK